jgi:FkbM family methyltransferase
MKVVKIKKSEQKDFVRWAYRLFLDREAENDAVLERYPIDIDTSELRNEFVNSIEFQNNFKDSKIGQINKELWVLHKSCYGFKIYVNLGEKAICRPILHDAYENTETKLVLTWVHPGDWVLDIGANIGYYSLLMSNIVGNEGRIFSFEPIPFLYERFEASILENGYKNIKVHKIALSDKESCFEMIYLPNAENAGGSFLNKSHEKLQGHSTINVKTTSLDNLTFEKHVAFLKMDAEGAENLILEGGQFFFKTNHPILLTEVHPFQLRRVSGVSAKIFINHLNEIGYCCYNVFDLKNEVNDWDEGRIGNLLCFPKT